MSQILVVMRKNLKVLFKTKLFVQSMYLPILSALLAILGKNGGATFIVCRILSPVYQCVAVNGYVRFAMLQIVNEKNERQKENQKIMGLKQLNYMAANFLFSIFTTVVIGLIYLLPSLVGNVYQEIQFMSVIGAYIIFCCALVGQVYFVSCFFTNSKIAVEAIAMINLIFAFAYTTVYDNAIRESALYLYGISIFPQAAISFTFFSKGWLIDSSDLTGLNFSFGQGILYMTLSFLGYLVAYLYFDQVWPNDFGTQKKPWFIFNPIIRLFRSRSSYVEMNDEDDQSGVEIEQNNIQDGLLDHSSAIFSQNMHVGNLKKAVSISNLVKKFSGFAAINRISLNLYEGQIFCLLGHNGAGKTTTINVITGMQRKTGGRVIMNGLDIDQDIDEIRKNIGLCSQKDILYDVLSVEEHLAYYADIKGLSGAQKERDIEYVIEKCRLSNERKKWAMHLSGGNKRKLCLAISLVGKAKFIFLDEPTSGVDPVTRTVIWEILREIKNDGRVVVLTTHHLEEAEALADRVGIMARGSLLALGTVEYITKQFGTGYYLKLSNKSDTVQDRTEFINGKQMLLQAVLQVIPEAQMDPQSQENVLKVLLPFQSQHQYANLFKMIEQNSKIMINLQMNSLEDAFINIGMEEDKYFSSQPSGRKSSQSGAVVADTIQRGLDQETIPVPAAFHRRPSYNMWAQIYVIIKRRFIYLINDWLNIVSLIIPFVFAFLGTFLNSTSNNGLASPTIYVVFMMFSLSFHSLSFVGLVIFEKEKNLKYSLRVMGCKMTAYWIGNLLSELIISVFLTLIFYGIFQMSSVSLAAFDLSPITFIMYLWCFVFSYICMSFFFSHMFNSIYDAVIGLPFFLLFAVFFGGLICMSLGFVSEFGWRLLQIFPMIISPTSILFMGLTLRIDLSSLLTDVPWLGINSEPYIIYGMIQSVVFLILSIVLEYYQFSSLWKNQTQQGLNQALQVNDPDVAQEDSRVLASADRIKAMRLVKQYPNGYTAVNSITFGVQPKQIFGLLGPNGAGKSTTFNILTARDSEFSGRAVINNVVATEKNEEAWSSSGVCPQFDCLWDHLTPKDHLEIYASLKGLSGRDREEVVNYYMRMMQLEDYVLRKSMNLSGGNKRKLGVCMSLIGGPSVQFLDEPSSGLDPIAKRFLWNTLQQSIQTRESSIVLTTHSMNEAESLCNKIGILINGQFSCMGSPEHLSAKYGNGYRLSLKLKPLADPLNVHQHVMQNILQAIPIPSKNAGVLIYQIHESQFIFSQTFFLIQGMHKSLIDDYSLHHANLEQIFSYFAGFQQQYIDPPRSNTADEICNCKGSNCARWCTLVCCCCVW